MLPLQGLLFLTAMPCEETKDRDLDSAFKKENLSC